MKLKFCLLLVFPLLFQNVISQTVERKEDLNVQKSDLVTGQDTSVTVMSGVYKTEYGGEIKEEVKISVIDIETHEVVGIYRPNRRTGKYLFILPPGKTYEVKYESDGNFIKSANLIVPVNTDFYRIHQKIDMGSL